MGKTKRWVEEYRQQKERKQVSDSMSTDNLLSLAGSVYEFRNKDAEDYISLNKRWQNLYKRALDYYNNEAYKGFYDTYSGTRSTDGYVSDTGRWYRDLESQRDAANEGVDELLAELDQYSRYYNEDAVSYVRDLITKRQSSYDDVLKDAGSFRDHWSQWATEDDYNTAVWESDFAKVYNAGDYDSAEKMLKERAEALFSKSGGDVLDVVASDNYRKLTELEEAIEQGKAYRQQQADKDAQRAEFLAYDAEAGRAELEALKKQADDSSLAHLEWALNKGFNALTLGLNKSGAPFSDKVQDREQLMALIQEKQDYYDKATEYQRINKLITDAQNDENFANYSTYDDSRLDRLVYNPSSESYNPMALVYHYINSDEETKKQIWSQTVRANGGGETFQGVGIADFLETADKMEKDEREMFNYLYSSPAGRDPANYTGNTRAEQYFNSIQEELKDRDLKDLGKWATQNFGTGLVASLGSVATSLGSAVEYVGDALQYGVDKLKDPYTAKMDTNSLAQTTNTIRGAVTDKVNLEINGWDAFDFVYNTAMSGADSMAAAFIPGGSAVLGLSAAAQGTNDALERGLSSDKAFWTGAVSGVFEGLFESISIGRFKSLQEAVVKGGKDIALNITKSMLVNASEEAATEAANILYDTIANGSLSNYEIMVQKYVNEGLSLEEAEKKAKGNLWSQVLESAASGAFMGLGFGAIGSGFSAHNTAKVGKGLKSDLSAQGRELGEITSGILDKENGFADNTAAYKRAQKIQSRLDAGKKVSNYSIGNLALNLSESQISSAIQSRLGEGSRAVADTIAKAISGEHVSNRALRAVMENDGAVAVINETLGTSFTKDSTIGAVRSAFEGSTNVKSSAESQSSVIKAFEGMSEDQISSRIRSGLSANVSDKGELDALTDIITDAAMGRSISDADAKRISSNQSAVNAINKRFGVQIKKGATASDVNAAIRAAQDASKSTAQADASQKRQQSSAAEISGQSSARFSVVKSEGRGFDVIAEGNGERGAIMHYETQQQAQAAAYAQTLKMGGEGLKGFVAISERLQGDVDLGEAALAFNAIYNQGRQGKAFAATKNGELLTPEQRQYAYQAGVVDGLLERGKKKTSEQALQNNAVNSNINTYSKEAQNEQELYLRQGGERNNGTNPGGQVSTVEVGTRQDQSRTAFRRPKDIGAAALSYGKEVSAKSLGIEGGIDAKKVRLIAEGSNTSAMKSARELAENRGLKVTFFAGDNLRVSKDGRIASVRGYVKGNEVFVRVDHSDYTADQIMRHEVGHDMIVKGEVDMVEIKGRIVKQYGKENVQFIADRYAEAYEESGLSAEEIWEEIICDSLGDMNAFASVDTLGSINGEFLKVLKSEVKDGTKDARGPPTQKNTADSGVGKYSIETTEDGIRYVKLDGNIFLKSDGTEMTPMEAYNTLVGKKIVLEDGDVITFIKKLPKLNVYKELFKKLPGFESGIDVRAISESINKNIVDVVTGSKAQIKNESQRHPHIGIKDFDQREVYLFDGDRSYRLELCIANLTDGTKIAYVKRYIEKASHEVDNKIKKAETAGQTRLNQPSNSSIPQKSDLSTDSEEKNSGRKGKASQDLDFFDFLNENAERDSGDSAEVAEQGELTDREILANALESIVASDSDKRTLNAYKRRIKALDAMETELSEVNAKIRELSFAPGARDKVKLNALKQTKTELEATIQKKDKALIMLEKTAPLQKVLERAKKQATEKAKAKARERIAEQRERAKEALDKQAKRYQESRKKGIEGRHKTEIRNKIRAFKDKLQKTLKHPTDRKYIPGALAQAMIDVCELIDTDTEFYKPDGTINKAQEKRNETRDRLAKLREEYKKISIDAEDLVRQEFDGEIAGYLEKLESDFKGKSLNDMSRAELEEMYEILSSIDGTLRNARKLLGEKDATDVYEAGDAVISEQRDIANKRKNGKRNAAQKLNDGVGNLSLSPMRRVLEICGYNKDSALYKLFKQLEEGVRKAEFFKMGAKKSFEALTTTKKYADVYEKAIYQADGGEKYTDVDGRRFGISKMGKMQAILSFEREVANKKTHHIEKGGLVFADLRELGNGKLKTAVDAEHSHKVVGAEAVKLIEQFKTELEGDRWAQKYMEAARFFFNNTAKNAINDTYMQLKHRILATDDAYIPFEVDQNSIVKEITGENDIQQTISSYGMLKDMQKGASNPLIITGLNNVLERHIEQVGTIQGLAIPIRDFNKVWNVKSADGSITVKEQIQKVAGGGAVNVITQTVRDLQGDRPRNDKLDGISRVYKKVKSNYISATFFANVSVMLKQIGSMFSATSVIDYRDPIRMMGNLIYTFANSEKIAAEVDKYTATAWMRRQGLSDAELKTLATERRKTKFGKFFDKVGSGGMIAMDYNVALSLWKYAKQDVAKKTGLRGEELLKATAEYYDEVIETTQSMTDVLHRPEIQRSGGVGTELLGTFKTDLYQNAGNLRIAINQFTNDKTSENAKNLVKTISGILTSAMWGSIVTSLVALARYKVDRYRDDEDDELTAESWLEVQGMDLLQELAGYVVPTVGSEIVEGIRNRKTGSSWGNVVASAIPYDAVNDLYSDICTISQKIETGKDLTKSDYFKIIKDCGNVLGIPTSNFLRTLEAGQLHIKDALNGEPLSFEAGLTESNAYRLYKAMVEGDADRIDKASRNFKNDDAITRAIREQLREQDPRIREAAAALVNGDVREYEKIFNEIYEEDIFKFEDIREAIFGEESSYNSMLKEAATAKLDDKNEEYESILDEIFGRYESVLNDDDILEDLDEMQGVVSDGRDAIEEAESAFKVKHINIAFDFGDDEKAFEVLDELMIRKIDYYVEKARAKADKGGKAFNESAAIKQAEKNAESSIQSSVTTYWKPKYITAYNNGDTDEMERIEQILNSIEWERKAFYDDVDETLRQWIQSE